MAEVNYIESMAAMFKNLEQVLTTKTVFGEAITVGDTTIIPVVDVSFGLGTGGGSGEDKGKGGGSGGGGGAGAKLSASAVIVIKAEHVQVMRIKQSTELGKLVDLIPDLVEKFSRGKEDKQET